AASAFYPSGWDHAAVIAFGTRGDMRPAALMSGEGHRLHSDREAAFPNSLGMVYGAVTSALGFSSEGDWHKTMWLSATGEPEYLDLFRDMLSVDDKGLPVVNLDYFDLNSGRTPALADVFFERTGLRPRAKDEGLGRCERNVARSLQQQLE